MESFCPACAAVFLGMPRCPRCGGPLAADGLTAAARPGTTPAGRLAVGAAAAVGLYVGLREVAAGWAGLTGRGPVGWAGVVGFGAVAVAVGAALAGVGRGRGRWTGAALGGACGGLFVLAERLVGGPAQDRVVLALPAALAALGGLAGAVGAWVWASPPRLDLPVPEPVVRSSIRLLPDPPPSAGRRTAWGQVLLGAAAVAAGVTLADEARTRAQRASGGVLKVDNRGQGRLIGLGLATLAGLAGGAAAAAGTGAGPRHGLTAGVLAAAGVVGLIVARGDVPAPAAVALDRLGVAAGPADPATLGAVAAGVVGVGLLGGWFGGVLFPPLAPRGMLRIGGD